MNLGVAVGTDLAVSAECFLQVPDGLIPVAAAAVQDAEVLGAQDMGGHGTLNVFATTEKFHTQNPKAFAAVKAAFIEAIQFINSDPRAAAEIFLKREPSKHDPDWIVNMMSNKNLVSFTPEPHRFGKLAAFLHQSGVINAEPASWRDLFFDQAAGLEGN